MNDAAYGGPSVAMKSEGGRTNALSTLFTTQSFVAAVHPPVYHGRTRCSGVRPSHL
ncbi:uncharacterized protein METZ01_LOCUS317681 [marine metagenome]|uniref:Uncharacterized protein n=1 Tax=marine metagenome TaxID=408172 RepID=A0A382NWL3_9ZZZZ